MRNYSSHCGHINHNSYSDRDDPLLSCMWRGDSLTIESTNCFLRVSIHEKLTEDHGVKMCLKELDGLEEKQLQTL